jgi:hypothetical protein
MTTKQWVFQDLFGGMIVWQDTGVLSDDERVLIGNLQSQQCIKWIN